MEVLRRRPAELWRSRGGRCKVTIERRAMRLGQRQPEERSDLQRPTLVPGLAIAQWVGAHELGAVGRQPNCELTESMPAARLSVWAMRTSSGMIEGSFCTASMAAETPSMSGIGTLSLVFFRPRA